MNTQDYKNKCQRLADLYSVAAISGQPFEYQWIVGTWKEQTIAYPNIYEKLEDWRVKPLPHPMEKYISLGLDMEFSCVDDKFNTNDSIHIGKLTGFEKLDSDDIFVADKIHKFYKCRLRPNHMHWWNGKSEDSPVPDNCKFRYYSKSMGWSQWLSNTTANNFQWAKILAFKICYSGDE